MGSGRRRVSLYMSKVKPRLLFFVTEDWYFWSHRLPIARAALLNGIEVLVVTRVNAHGELIKREGFKLIPLNINRSGMNPFQEIVTFLSLLLIYKKEKPDTCSPCLFESQ